MKTTAEKTSNIDKPVTSNVNKTLAHSKTPKAEENQKVTDDEWTTVQSRKRKQPRRKPIVGCSTNTTLLQAVPKTAYLHVYRLSPNTTIEALEQHLQMKIPVSSVEKLNSRQPLLYSSFKVSVDHTHLEEMMNPTIWPNRAYVNRFFHIPQKRKSTM